MNTCKNCFWWTQRVDKTGTCGKEGTMPSSPKFFRIHVEVADDHGLHSELITGPDFGCVQFELKDKE